MSEFSTKEFYLSCWLYASNIKLKEIRKLNGSNRCEFVFEDSTKREKLIKEYWNKKGNVAPKIFVDAIKDLKNRLYSDTY